MTDGGGLYLLIPPSGGKLWRLDYTFLAKRKTFFLKSYPEISLLEARQRRDEARKLLANGIDLGEEKKEAIEAAAVTAASIFEVVAREVWLPCLVCQHLNIVAEIFFDVYHYFIKDLFVAFFHSSRILFADVGMQK